MALDITHVQAGELITSTLANELIDELEKLDVRITVLESAATKPGPVEITDVYPTPAQVRADVTILGKNFGVSVGATRVRFNGVSPTIFRDGSNDTAIICDVPDLTGLAAGGSTVELTVSNAQTTATREITVLPVKQEQLGELKIQFVGTSPDPSVAGQNADFEFSLTAEDATLPEPVDMTITPTITVGGANVDWPITILDATKSTIANRKITIAQGDTKPFFVHATIPSDAGDVAFLVRADGAGSGFTASSGSQSLTVGHTVNQDPTITELVPTKVTHGTLDGSKVSVPANAVAEIFVETHLTAAPATYNVTFTPSAGLNGWTTSLYIPPVSDPTLNTQLPDLNQPGNPAYALTFIHLHVVPSTGASSGQAVLTVQRPGETSKRSFTFDLSVAPSA